MHDAPSFLFITIQIGSFSLCCDNSRISLIYVFPVSNNSSYKLIKPSNQPARTFFCQFCTHLFYIEGNGKEGKVHEDLVLSKMSDAFVVHVVFNLSEHGFRFYASLPSVFQPFLGAEQLFSFPLVFPKSVIQFYRPVSFCFKTTAPQGTVFTPDSSVPGIFADIFCPVNVFHIQADETFGREKEHGQGKYLVDFLLHPVVETVDGNEIRFLIAGQPNIMDVTVKELFIIFRQE